MDYNAGFTGAVARLYRESGGYTLDETTPPPPPATLLHATMDTFPTGPKTDAQWTCALARHGVGERPATRDGSRWTTQIAYGGQRKVGACALSAGRDNSPDGSGAQWFIDIGGGSEDLYMSYWVRFDPGFDFVLGGKLPGFGGGVSFADRTHEWSGRLMWRENGKAEFYVHVPAGNEYDPGDRFWWNTEGFQAQFIPGRWHHIEIHMRLNTPGQFDGLMEGWFDGVKAAHYPAFYFRDAPTASMKIAWVFFSTFFGGSSSAIWQATKDEHANFDHFTVSNTRIGYPGLPADVDADKLPNAWELQHFGSDSAADALADTDGDGHTNFDEYLAGTLPLSAADRFASTASRDEQRHAADRSRGKSRTPLPTTAQFRPRSLERYRRSRPARRKRPRHLPPPRTGGQRLLPHPHRAPMILICERRDRCRTCARRISIRGRGAASASNHFLPPQ